MTTDKKFSKLLDSHLGERTDCQSICHGDNQAYVNFQKRLEMLHLDRQDLRMGRRHKGLERGMVLWLKEVHRSQAVVAHL